MDIDFKTRKLEKIFNVEKSLIRIYGKELSGKIKVRMAVLSGAACLQQVPTTPPARCHQLKGGRDEEFAVDLKHPYRLVFEVATDPVPRREDGGIDLEKVTAILIIEVVDYH